MNKKTIVNLLTIASVCFSLSAIIFICLCLFTDEKNTTYLCIALSSIALSNLYNVIKKQYLK